MAFREQLTSAVIFGLKWSKTKFVYLLGPPTISKDRARSSATTC